MTKKQRAVCFTVFACYLLILLNLTIFSIRFLLRGTAAQSDIVYQPHQHFP